MSARSSSACGTYAGAQQHRKRGEEVCQPCRNAAAAYLRDWRARNPQSRAKERQQNNARSRALWRLADEFPDRFRELVADELRADA